MFTIKQMEALYWVSTLGSFEAAADYLNMVQSTISKRIGELYPSIKGIKIEKTWDGIICETKSKGERIA